MARHRPPTNAFDIVYPKNVGIDIQESKTYNPVNRVSIRSRFPARVIRNGPKTGERYEWDDAGSVVAVHPDDVEGLLTVKTQDGACCGGSNDGYYFFERI